MKCRSHPLATFPVVTALVAKLVIPYLSDEHFLLLEQVRRGPEFLSMAKGNAKLAKTMRQDFAQATKAIMDS